MQQGQGLQFHGDITKAQPCTELPAKGFRNCIGMVSLKALLPANPEVSITSFPHTFCADIQYHDARRKPEVIS